MKKSNAKILFLTHAALIAALYVVLTYIANMLGIASGAIQVRFSEALTILPYFTPAAIPGLFAGCLLSNFLTGAPLPDIVFGSLATLIGALLTAKFRQNKWFAPIPPILANAVIIPPVLLFAYGIRPLWFSYITVTIGEIISCGVLGMLLLFALEKSMKRFFAEQPFGYLQKEREG
ncbi:MAG: QueT transporter family protein [Lachnospiraceae bacterium]|nr:QueT transporter family protein [Lachnospiraceae bacterium]